MKEMVLSKLLGVDDDVPESNSMFNNDSSNSLLLPTPFLPELSSGSDVKQSDPIDTTLNVTPQSTQFSPANPSSPVSHLPSPSSSPPPPLSSPPTSPSSPTISQTSSSIVSAHKCPEYEDITLHSIASTSEPINQFEQLSTQPLQSKIPMSNTCYWALKFMGSSNVIIIGKCIIVVNIICEASLQKSLLVGTFWSAFVLSYRTHQYEQLEGNIMSLVPLLTEI